MYTVTDICSEEDIFLLEKEAFPNEYWSEELIKKDMLSAIYLVCKKGTETLGYVCASCILDEAELNRVAVKASHRRKGIATLLVNELKNLLKSKGCNVLMLEVRSQNIKALNLYASLGFSTFAKRKSYYQNPIDDAVLMSVRL